MTEEATFNWGDLPETWWRDAAAQVGASELQTKFAAARFRGCSATQSARESGYCGGKDGDSIRQMGYRAYRTTAVQNLLALAAGEAKGVSGVVDGDEARRILSKLARSSDPNVKIRAVESLQKMEERKAEFGRMQETDCYAEDRLVRDFLRMPGGAAAVVCLHMHSGVAISRISLLHDVYAACQRDPVGSMVWDAAVKQCSDVMQIDLKENLAEPGHQLDDRIKIWREVGIEVDVPAGVVDFLKTKSADVEETNVA